MNKVVGVIMAAFVFAAAFGMVLGPDAAAQSSTAGPSVVDILGSSHDVGATNVGPGSGDDGPICSPCGWQNLANMVDGINSMTSSIAMDDQFDFGDSEALGLRDFGFTIPSGDEIFGIELTVAGDVTTFASGVGNLWLALAADTSTVWANATNGTTYAIIGNVFHLVGPVSPTAGGPGTVGALSGREVGWPHTGAGLGGLVTGSPSDKWGAASISPATLNAATFGIIFHNSAAGPGSVLTVDGFSMEIFHGLPPTNVVSFLSDGANTGTFTLIFDEAVSGVVSGGFTANLSGDATSTGISVTGSGDTYTITVDGLADDGGVTVTLLADGSITSDGNGAAFDAPGRSDVTSDSQVVGSGIPGLPSLQVPFIQK